MFAGTWNFQYLGTLIGKEWHFYWWIRAFWQTCPSVSTSTFHTAQPCLGVYGQGASGPGPSLSKTSYKVPGGGLQWVTSRQEQQASEGSSSRSYGCWPLVYSHLILLSQSSQSHTEKHAIISHSLSMLGNNIHTFIPDWPKCAGSYSVKLGRNVRKVHVRNCSSQYMFLASNNLRFMNV